MCLHEGLSWVHSQKKPRFHFGESLALSRFHIDPCGMTDLSLHHWVALQEIIPIEEELYVTGEQTSTQH